MQEKAIQTREELELAELEGQITGGRVPGDYAKKLRKLNEELEAELADKDPDFKRASDGKMSFEQKRRISLALGALPGDKLYRVLEIVSESIKDCGDEDEEVELDIDALDDDTLRKLQDFVDSVLPSHSVPKNNPSSKSAGQNLVSFADFIFCIVFVDALRHLLLVPTILTM